MNPDEKMLNEHLNGAEFQLGTEDEKWGLVETSIDWPKRIFWVQSSIPPLEQDRYYFLFDLENYPNTAPTSMPWDIELNKGLEFSKWPKGTERINAAFNHGWNNGTALYIPCDRIAMNGHETWRQQFPHVWWSSDKTIVHYLRTIYKYLN